MQVVLDAFETEGDTTLELVLVSDFETLEDSQQDLISPCDVLVRLHVLLGSCLFLVAGLLSRSEQHREHRGKAKVLMLCHRQDGILGKRANFDEVVTDLVTQDR